MDQDTKAEVKTDLLKMEPWYWLWRSGIRLFLRIICRFEIEGLEHVPAEGPYLVVTNHLHWLDAPITMAILPHRTYVFAAAKWDKTPALGLLFRSMKAIFVRRGEVDRKALRKDLTILKEGGDMGMAPEGTRSKTGAMQRGRSGAAYLSYRAGVPLIPVVTTGQGQVSSSLRRLRRARVRAVYGPAFEPPPVPAGGRAGTAQIHAFSEEIMYRLAAMLPPEYRGVYSDISEKYPDLVAQHAASLS